MAVRTLCICFRVSTGAKIPCAVAVDVEDRNDIPPVFVSVPEPITVNDDQKIGTIVGSMPAIDADGTAPGNVVRYEMVGRAKAQKYFQVDPDTGVIRLRDELNKDDDTEYQVDVRAFDLGDPQLSSVATLPVFVRHLLNDPNGGAEEYEAEVKNGDFNSGTFSNQIGLAFSEDNYVAHVLETSPVNTTVKAIQIVNSKKATKVNPGFKCDIVKGNIFGQFWSVVENHSCIININKQLDFENKSFHDLDVKLSSLKYFVNPLKSVTKLKIVVQDENDNPPVFVIPSYSTNSPHSDTYYGVVPVDADIDTAILQVKATDKDSGKFGMIKYRIFSPGINSVGNDKEITSYFTISEDTGIVRLQKSVKNIKNLPVTFSVEAMDNNGESNGHFNTAYARIVINTISDINRMSLVFSDASSKDVRSHSKALEELISEKTSGLIAGIERFSSRKFLTANGTVEEDPNATDVWFYVIDPKTEMILERNSTVVEASLIEADAQSELSFAASGIAKIRKLDREDLTRYQLILRAEDNGGLSTTATVNIRVTDINDNNPEFDENSLPYKFSVEEGRADTVVGVVHAVDADEGMNANITYSLPSDIPFKIHPQSGEIRTITALDYEKVKEYKFVVTAKDGAPDTRLGTASVSVKVTDVADEVPIFSDDRIDVRVPENVPDLTIATVKATDPDTRPEITYQLRQGAVELFRVDPKNGQVKTIRGLDYEKEKTHELIIGTVENDGNDVGDVVRIHTLITPVSGATENCLRSFPESIAYFTGSFSGSSAFTTTIVAFISAPSLTCTSYTGFTKRGGLVLGPGVTDTSTIACIKRKGI
uniref:Cadherin domain-containing protein n=1 Tax=Phlebotomus papatasi TaxID=29031 RepID=A0A1B0D2Q1_PHLPP